MTKSVAAQQDILLTFSQNAAHNEHLTRALDHDLAEGKFRIMAKYNNSSKFVELQYAYSDSAVVHGGSTAFCPHGGELALYSEFSPADARDLAQLNLQTLIKVERIIWCNLNRR